MLNLKKLFIFTLVLSFLAVSPALAADVTRVLMCDEVVTTGQCSPTLKIGSYSMARAKVITVELQASGQPATSFTASILGANDPNRFVDPNLTIGSTKPNVASDAFTYWIGGSQYSKDAVAAGTALSGDNLPDAKTGAWALDIGSNGTIDITPATDNATGYANVTAALAGVPDVAAAHVRLGYVFVANASGGAFVPGTTDLDAAGITDTYQDNTGNPESCATNTYTIGTPASANFSLVDTCNYKYLKISYDSKVGGGATSALTAHVSAWEE